MEKLKVQTLVKGKGKFREFYGYVDGVGWCTSSLPIKLINPGATMKDFKKIYKDHDFKGVRLVEIKMKITEK